MPLSFVKKKMGTTRTSSGRKKQHEGEFNMLCSFVLRSFIYVPLQDLGNFLHEVKKVYLCLRKGYVLFYGELFKHFFCNTKEEFASIAKV